MDGFILGTTKEKYSNDYRSLESMLIEGYSELINRVGKIDSELYAKFDVKRGLRDINGKGVLAGLTEIGEVHAYIVDEGESIPIPGRLIYRGVDLFDLVDGFMKENRFGFEETAHLLLFSNLPNKTQLKSFEALLAHYRKLPVNFVEDAIMKMKSNDVMNMLSRCVLALYTYDKKADDISTSNIIRQSIQIISQMPILAVYGY